MKQISAEVISISQILLELERLNVQTSQRPEARNITGSWLIWLRCPPIAREARPGQFIMVRCGSELVLPRPFSLHQIKGDEIALFFTVWEDGKGTKWLSQRQVGDKVALFGPLGNGFAILPTSHNLLLVAGGIGIAPLYFLAQVALNQGYSVTLLRGASGEDKPSGKPNPSQHYPEALLPRGIELHTITSSSDGKRNMVTELIPIFADRAEQVFACGPRAMYHEMKRQKREFRLEGKPVQISLEMRLGCGLGLCYGCTVKTKNGLKQVCKDGPVFDLDAIVWDELDY